MKLNKDERVAYLRNYLKGKDSFSYNGPKRLFKYRKFDQFTYEMIENNYFYLCPSTELDDETECMSTIDSNSFMDLTTNSLKRTGIEAVTRMIKPYCKEGTYDEICRLIYLVSRGGRIDNSFLLDISPELQNCVEGVDIIPFINTFVNLSDQLEDPKTKEQLMPAILFALKREEIGICALGDSADNEDLWKRYGKAHTGYCVEYDASEISYEQAPLPVIYEDERQTNLCLAIVNVFICKLVSIFSEGKISF